MPGSHCDVFRKSLMNYFRLRNQEPISSIIIDRTNAIIGFQILLTVVFSRRIAGVRIVNLVHAYRRKSERKFFPSVTGRGDNNVRRLTIHIKRTVVQRTDFSPAVIEDIKFQIIFKIVHASSPPLGERRRVYKVQFR